MTDSPSLTQLDTHRQQPVGRHFERLAIDIQRPHLDLRRPLDVVIHARHRQTALVVDLFLGAGPDDFRIDEDLQRIVRFRHVDHHQLFVHVDLGRGQPDAGRLVQSLGHVGHQLLQARVEYGYRLGNFMQARIGITQDI